MDLNDQIFFSLQNNTTTNSTIQIRSINGVENNSENEKNILISGQENSATIPLHQFPLSPGFSVLNKLSNDQNCQLYPQASTTTLLVKQLANNYEAIENIHPVKFEENCDNVVEKELSPFIIYATENNLQNNLLSTSIRCEGCCMEIHERHMLCVSGPQQLVKENNQNNMTENNYWHEQCLKCVKCNKHFGGEISRCFEREGRIFCFEDYSKLFGPNSQAPCSRCGQLITATELVYRSAGIYVYHLHCFVCFCCGQQLTLGEKYINIDGQLICQKEVELWRLQQQQMAITTVPQLPITTRFLSIPTFPEIDFSIQRQDYHLHHHRRRHRDRSKKFPKRPRTILNAPQRKAFRYAFDKGQKPSRKVREQLARDTGLSIRVVQVWFQNQRAKMKKESRREFDKQHNIEGGGGSVEFENNGTERQIQSGSSAEEEIIDNEASDESDVDSSDDDDDDLEEKEDNISSNQNKETFIEERIEEKEQQNPIEKLYNMHQTYFA